MNTDDTIKEVIDNNSISVKIEEGTDLVNEIYTEDFIKELKERFNIIPKNFICNAPDLILPCSHEMNGFCNNSGYCNFKRIK